MKTFNFSFFLTFKHTLREIKLIFYFYSQFNQLKCIFGKSRMLLNVYFLCFIFCLRFCFFFFVLSNQLFILKFDKQNMGSIYINNKHSKSGFSHQPVLYLLIFCFMFIQILLLYFTFKSVFISGFKCSYISPLAFPLFLIRFLHSIYKNSNVI